MINDKINKSFNGLDFEPVGHTYNLNGKNLMPVSHLIERFYEGFDVEQKAKEYAERHGGDPIEIANAWEQNRINAATFGTQVHDFAERYYYKPTLQPSNNHEMAVVKFWKELPPHIKKVRAELRVYNEYLEYAGTIDNLFFDERRNGLIISDYKTNKDLYKNFMGKRMYEPFEHLLDMPLSHYELQLSSYQLALESKGLNVIERWIIWLLPDGTYEKILATDYSMQIQMELLRKELC